MIANVDELLTLSKARHININDISLAIETLAKRKVLEITNMDMRYQLGFLLRDLGDEALVELLNKMGRC